MHEAEDRPAWISEAEEVIGRVKDVLGVRVLTRAGEIAEIHVMARKGRPPRQIVRDIVTAVQNDNTGAFCDALSVGFGFNGVPARIGNPYGRPPAMPQCGSQWDDDCLK